LVHGVVDVASSSPRRYFFEVLKAFAEDALEAERLSYFATPEGREDLYRYNQQEGEAVGMGDTFIATRLQLCRGWAGGIHHTQVAVESSVLI
jgi:hypothetical protein